MRVLCCAAAMLVKEKGDVPETLVKKVAGEQQANCCTALLCLLFGGIQLHVACRGAQVRSPHCNNCNKDALQPASAGQDLRLSPSGPLPWSFAVLWRRRVQRDGGRLPRGDGQPVAGAGGGPGGWEQLLASHKIICVQRTMGDEGLNCSIECAFGRWCTAAWHAAPGSHCASARPSWSLPRPAAAALLLLTQAVASALLPKLEKSRKEVEDLLFEVVTLEVRSEGFHCYCVLLNQLSLVEKWRTGGPAVRGRHARGESTEFSKGSLR